jgi:photosystem II stability/assembly factor-like uncharacterized protein
MKSGSRLPKFKFKLATLLMLGFVFIERPYAFAQSWTSTNLSNNWTSVAISAGGRQIAAASYLGGIYTSTNGGTNWTDAGVLEPGRAVLAAAANGSNLVAAFFDGNIYTSPNWGANSNWVQSGAPLNYWNCLAASADGSKIVAGTSPGLIYGSGDSGATWTGLSAPMDFWQSVASSASGSNLLAASHSGYVYSSTNAGSTWNELAIAMGATNAIASDTICLSVVYTNLNISALNTNKFITNLFNPILTIPPVAVSTDNFIVNDGFGVNLTGTAATGTNVMTVGLTVDAQGSNVLDVNPLIMDTLGRVGAAVPAGITNSFLANLTIPGGTGIFNTNGVLQTNLVSILNTNVSGISLFITNVLNVEVAIANLPQSWSSVASSADGNHVAAAANGGLIYTSTNAGATWGPADLPNTNWSAVAVSADGDYLAAAAAGGLLYTSPNGGLSWVAANVSAANWSALAVSADGSVQTGTAYGGAVYFDDQVVSPPVPRIVSITDTGGEITVYFTTINGAIYTLYSTNSAGLGGAVTNWLPVSSLAGDGGTDYLSGTASNLDCFYRVGAHH